MKLGACQLFEVIFFYNSIKVCTKCLFQNCSVISRNSVLYSLNIFLRRNFHGFDDSDFKIIYVYRHFKKLVHRFL